MPDLLHIPQELLLMVMINPERHQQIILCPRAHSFADKELSHRKMVGTATLVDHGDNVFDTD